MLNKNLLSPMEKLLLPLHLWRAGVRKRAA